MQPPNDPLAEAIRGIDTAALDCIQVNAAVLADVAHGAGTYLALGARLRFAPRTPPGSRLPTVEQRPADQIGIMGDTLGLVMETGVTVSDGQELLALLPEDGSALYAVGDAFHMPWLPYHRHQHMDHSVLLRAADAGTAVEVVDAYDNETPYGRAEPVVCAFDRAGAAALFDGSTTLQVTVRPGPAAQHPVAHLTEANAREAALLLEGDAPQAYAAAFQDHDDQHEACTALLLETWLLHRSRRLHAAWAADRAPGTPLAETAATQAALWEDLAAQAYLAMRRVQRGRPVPPQIFTTLADLLRADAQAALDTHRAGGPSGPAAGVDDPEGTETAMTDDRAPVRATVVDIVAGILGATTAQVAAVDDLSNLEGFASFQMVEMVERLEGTYGVEFAPGDLEPQVLRHVEALVALVLSTTSRTEATRP
ncbi:acyl carrier protein [Streptomyces sp. NPDC007088]|uniref:acyl carrier protein n=1 Tax=Streptomyces sp. NPDC007088 TaxID=3364773 RepID=UPI00369C0AF6